MPRISPTISSITWRSRPGSVAVAGLACAWLHRDMWRSHMGRFLWYAVYPLFSAVCLGVVAIYAFSTFDPLTRAVGLGGLLLGALFFRPQGYSRSNLAVIASAET